LDSSQPPSTAPSGNRSGAAPAAAPSAAATPRLAWWWFLLPIVCAAAFRDLWAPDEPRYAMVARWIYDHGDFVVLRRCGTLYPDKPPFVYWLSGLLGFVTNWNVFAMRLVSIGAMAGVAWMTQRIAAAWLGPREGQWAPVLFLGFALILWNGARIALDPLLTFGCVGAIYFLSASARDSREATRQVLFAGALLGVGMFSKGPVAFVNAGLPLVAWFVFRTRPNSARASKLAYVGATLLAVVPVLAWALAACLQEPALWGPLFFGQHLGRVAADAPHRGPPWDHLVQLPAFLLPWSVPVVFGFVDGYRALRAHRSGDANAAGLARVWLWAIVLLVFFSIIPPKRELYLMTAYPAFAMLGAQRLVRAIDRARIGAGSAAVPLALFVVLGLGLAVAAPASTVFADRASTPIEVASDIRRLHAAYPDLLVRGLIPGVVFLVGAALTLRARLRRDFASFANGVAITWCVGAAATLALIAPVIDTLKSDRAVAATIAARPEKPDEIPCYATFPEGPRFYGAGPCVYAETPELKNGEFELRAEREGPDFLALVRESNWLAKDAAERDRFVVLERMKVGSRDLVLVGSK